MKSSRVFWRVLAFLIGLFLLMKSVEFISWNELYELFQRGGLALLWVLCVYPVSQIFFNVGFRSLFPPSSRSRIDFVGLYSVRLIGEGLNQMTPFVDIGGEPVRVILIQERGLAPLDQAVTAVCMSRIVYVFTEIVLVLFLLPLLLLSGHFLDLGWIAFAGAAISCIYLFLLVTAQKKGAIRIVPKIAEGLKKRGLEVGEGRELWNRAEEDLRHFYRDRKEDFLICFFWNLVGWAATVLEVYLALRILGLPITWRDAYLLQMLLQAIKTASFFIPANLGSQEGGLAFATARLGFSATDGFALSLIKRFRIFVAFLVGMVLWAVGNRMRSLRATDSRASL